MDALEEQAFAFADTLALSSLFSNTIESLGLILPFHEGRKSETLLLAKLSIQQDRLLCWASILGVTSPAASTGITHAIPRHAGSTNPDPSQPINFALRDSRLDDNENRKRIDEALHGIGDPLLKAENEDLRKGFGVKHFRGGRFTEQPYLNVLRLEAFREKVALLEDVTHNYELPDLPRKKNRSLMPRWYIEDEARFADYLQVITENVDYLIKFMDVQPAVDRAMKMDIRAMGWHPSDLQVDIARMGKKLSVIREASAEQYPEYSVAAREAMDNTLGVWKGSESYPASPISDGDGGMEADLLRNPVISAVSLHTAEEAAERLKAVKAEKESRPSVFGFLRRKSGKQQQQQREQDRRKSYDGSSLTGRAMSTPADVKRSNSTSVPTANEVDLDPPRSLSVHAMTEKEFGKARVGEDLAKVPTNTSTISRHDMFKGLHRLQTNK